MSNASPALIVDAIIDSMSDAKRPPSQLVVRNLDPELVRRLKARAVANGRSAEAEHRAILDAALRPEVAEAWAEIFRFRDQLAAKYGVMPDSTDLIREDRDTDHGRDPTQSWRRGQPRK
jgi:plasmid stability protein